MKHAILSILLFAGSVACAAQGVLLTVTGNVDTVQFSTFQVVNPDPAGTPLTIPQIGVEYHVMDMDRGGQPLDMKIFFPLMPDDARHVNNCIRWFNKVQAQELKLNFNGQPGFWDGLKSPWPYLQITFKDGTQQIHTHDLNGNDVWLWDGKDVQCWEVMDWHAPYFPNP